MVGFGFFLRRFDPSIFVVRSCIGYNRPEVALITSVRKMRAHCGVLSLLLVLVGFSFLGVLGQTQPQQDNISPSTNPYPFFPYPSDAWCATTLGSIVQTRCFDGATFNSPAIFEHDEGKPCEASAYPFLPP